VRILRARELLEDNWSLEREPGTGAVAPGARVIVPLERWRAERDALASRFAAVGVLVPNTADIEATHPEIADRPLIALEFPRFADGRALSQAVVLRKRLRFEGELRAVGDIIRDLVYWLGRCGFDAIVPRADQDLEACRLALDELSVVYQDAADGRIPARRRRAGAQRKPAGARDGA
jgi:uncharacterized protein (DUF934 family)